jgi:hypothetical protein
MSFDVFFQGFRNGDAAAGGGDRMRQVLAPFIVGSEPEHRFVHVEYGDGSADVYLDDDDMMANHISGTSPWEVLVEGAKAAGWVILPIGCPTCLTDEAQRSHLPEGIDEDVVLVGSGWDLLQVIRSA